jgi:hypothetical protein
VSGIIWEKVIERYTGEATNEERVKEGPVVPRLESELDGYEAILTPRIRMAAGLQVGIKWCNVGDSLRASSRRCSEMGFG